MFKFKKIGLLFLCFVMTLGTLTSCFWGARVVTEGTEGLFFSPLPDGTYGVKAGQALFLEEIVIPDTYRGKPVTAILREGFMNATNLKRITLPDSIKTIGEYAFSGCASLTGVVIPNGVRCIAARTFYSCQGLTEIVIPDSVTGIGDYAFFGCSSLTSITIPNSVTSIGEAVFARCSGLTSMTVPFSSVTKGCEMYPFGYFFGEKSYFGGTEVKQTVYHTTFPGRWSVTYCIPSGLTSVTITGDRVSQFSFKNYDWLTDVVLEDSVIVVEGDAFNHCLGLSKIRLSNNLISIDGGAFGGCIELTAITIPNRVRKIGYDAFFGCVRLFEVYNLSSHITVKKGERENGCIGYYAREIYLSDQTPSKLLTDEEGYTFFEDEQESYLIGYKGSATKLQLPTTCNGKPYNINHSAFRNLNKLTDIIIPEGVTHIDSAAFAGCDRLENLTVPLSVTSIGSSVCSALTNVFYGGTASDWNAIQIARFNEVLDFATVYYYSETQPTTDGNYWRYVDGVPTAW